MVYSVVSAWDTCIVYLPLLQAALDELGAAHVDCVQDVARVELEERTTVDDQQLQRAQS